MSERELVSRIREFGFANAIVYLDPDLTRLNGSTIGLDGGRIIRRPASLEAPALASIEDLFAIGWDEVRKRFQDGSIPPDGLSEAMRRLLTSDRDAGVESRPIYFSYLGVLYGALNTESLRRLQQRSEVSRISFAPALRLIVPKQRRVLAKSMAGAISWGLKRVRAPELWEQGFTGKNVLIAHLDTGADSVHAVLQGAVTDHIVFNDVGFAVAGGGPCIDSDKLGHGTHTASTLAGRQLASEPVVGMAPDAELACGTVIEGGWVVARILSGLNWALESGARILNLSVGVDGYEDDFEDLIQLLRAQQLLPVIAVGNGIPGTSCSPGNYQSALSVGATGPDNKVWGLSGSEQIGDATVPVLCAPGVDVVSALPAAEKFGEMSGTSMATPHVAGLAALLFEAKPAATIDEVQDAIVASCQNLAAEPQSRIGAGIPDGLKAIAAL